MVKVTIKECECLRCGHKWFPRANNRKPTFCAKCKNPLWNRPRKVK